MCGISTHQYQKIIGPQIHMDTLGQNSSNHKTNLNNYKIEIILSIFFNHNGIISTAQGYENSDTHDIKQPTPK